MTDKDILLSDLNDISEILNNNGYGGWCATIRKTVAMLKEQEWIPAMERLPEEEGNYIAYFTEDTKKKYWHIGECHYSTIGRGEKRNWTTFIGFKAYVTHWMPLPKAPQEGRRSE